MVNRFALEIKQGEIWVFKGYYSSVAVAFQCQHRRYPYYEARVVESSENYEFESFSNTFNLMEEEERRFSNAEIWHRRFVARREQLQRLRQQLEEEREEDWLFPPYVPLITTPVVLGNVPKARKPHIKWNVDGF